MEGLKFGWKKAVKQYHYYNDGMTISLCSDAIYEESDFKELEFFSEIEITSDMNFCPSCYIMRQKQIRNQIVQHHKQGVGFWDDSCVCPKCKTPVMFFNHTKTHEHLCTVCDEMVVIP